MIRIMTAAVPRRSFGIILSVDILNPGWKGFACGYIIHADILKDKIYVAVRGNLPAHDPGLDSILNGEIPHDHLPTRRA